MKIKKFNESNIIDDADMIDAASETKFAKEYKLELEVVTIVDYDIEMIDDYNGRISIELSTGEEIEYSCTETTYDRWNTTGQGTNAKVKVTLDGKEIMGNDFLEHYGGDATWLMSVMNLYEDYLTGDILK